MAKVFSPSAPAQEIAGMSYAEKYFVERQILGAELCRLVGRVFYARNSGNTEAFADGFRRMAYIVSQTRT